MLKISARPSSNLCTRFVILFWLAFGIFLDIFVFDFTSDLVILLLAGLWILLVWLYQFEGRISIALALGFLTLCPFLLILDKETVAEKMAIWAYIFLVIGVVQQIIEYRNSKS